MSPAAALHAQLASIVEVLANTAVAEICELVDSGYAVLQLEVSRSRKENDVLRRKLRLMELRAARFTGLRVASTAGGTALLANGRARAQHPSNGPRRTATLGGEAVLCGDPDLSSGREATRRTPAEVDSVKLTIKVEDDESWSQTEPNQDFPSGVDGHAETEAPPPLTKQEVADEGVSSTSMCVQNPLPSTQTSEVSGGYDCLMYEPQLQHGSLTTQNPLREDPSCSYALNTSVSVSAASDSGSFPFSVSDEPADVPAVSHNTQQRAPLLPADEPQLPVGKDVGKDVARDRWRPQDGDGGGKMFVCNFCGKSLACLKNLKTHMRVHTGEKPFVCSLCGKRFSDSSNLKRHQSVHTGEKRYGCMHCGKRFAQSGSLKVHMSVHTDCKQFRCSYCGKTFISGSHLRRHVTVHAGDKRYAPTFQ